MQCTSNYPCPPELVNLRAMAAMGERLGAPYGLSDHTPGHLDVGRGGRARRGRRREALHALEAAVRARPPRVARRRRSSRGSSRASAQVEAAMGNGLKERDPSLDPARATFEKSDRREGRDPGGRRARAGDADDEAARERDPGAAARRGRRPDARPASSRPTTSSRRPTLSERRKVCVVVASRANYARIKTALEAIRDHPDLELQLVAGASLVLERFGNALEVLTHGRLRARRDDPLHHRGRDARRRWRSRPASACSSCRRVFELLQPDVVVTVADRFETIATAVAAAYMNIPVAHTQGGEVSGSIDESVRHAVTKLAHVHFPATELAAQRVIAMGEDPAWVFNVGCPSIDLVARTELGLRRDVLEQFGGIGAPVDPEQPFLLVMQHPVTTEYGHGFDQINETLEAVARARDAGARLLAERRRGLRGRRQGHPHLPRARPGARLPLLPQPAAGGLREADGALRLHGRQLVGGAARGLVPRHAGGHRRHAPAGPRARPEPGRGRARPRPRSPTRSATRSPTAVRAEPRCSATAPRARRSPTSSREVRPSVQKKLLLDVEQHAARLARGQPLDRVGEHRARRPVDARAAGRSFSRNRRAGVGERVVLERTERAAATCSSRRPGCSTKPPWLGEQVREVRRCPPGRARGLRS